MSIPFVQKFSMIESLEITDMNLRIRELREARELRQIDVALATKIDQKTLSNYETGKTLPDTSMSKATVSAPKLATTQPGMSCAWISTSSTVISTG